MSNQGAVTQNQSCARCGHDYREADRYCSQCGYQRDAPVPWYYHPLGIIVLTLTVMGPFSIFLVLKSPLMDRKTKIIYNVAIALVSLWFCYYLYQVFSQAMLQLDEAFGIE